MKKLAALLLVVLSLAFVLPSEPVGASSIECISNCLTQYQECREACGVFNNLCVELCYQDYLYCRSFC